jgi:NADH-quinone oxidoreductase subunit G
VDRTAAAALGKRAAEFYDAAPDENLADETRRKRVSAVIQDLRESRRPVIVCGTGIVPPLIPGLAADLALLLQAAQKRAGLFYLLPGANAFGSGLVSDPEKSFLQIIEGIENGDIKALILAECDPVREFEDRKRLKGALEKLELLIVMDYLNSEAVQKAHMFLPTATLYEAGGFFINQEARLQVAVQAYKGGLPIVQSGGGDHPTRNYGAGIPEAEARPAWRMLAELVDKNIEHMNDRAWLADVIPELASLPQLDDIPDDGVRFESAANADLRFKGEYASAFDKIKVQGDHLELILVDWTFGTEELSAYSSCLWELEPEPCATMHTRDAESLDLSDGNRVVIETESGSLEVNLRVAENMAPGVLVIPRHRILTWQIFETGSTSIGREQIKKVAA